MWIPKLSALFLLAPIAALAATATISWTPAVTRADGSTLTGTPFFNLYQGPSGAEVKVLSGLTTPSVVVTTGLPSGSTVCFAVTQVEAATGLESSLSIEACKTFPALPPSPPSPPTGVQVK